MSEEVYGNHIRYVAELEARLAALGERGAAVVVLVGSSGVGKSAVVRTFYERLRGQRSDPYWRALTPTQRLEKGHGVDPMPGRKILGPDIAPTYPWPPHALPTFGWWTVHCERFMDGSTHHVAAALAPQFDTHLLPLMLSWRKDLGLAGESLTWFKATLKAATEATGDEALGELAERLEALGLPQLPLATLAGLGWKIGKFLKRRYDDAVARESEVDLAIEVAARNSLLTENLAQTVTSVSSPSIPSIVALEDMHAMTPGLGDFLKALIKRRNQGPLLVVGTAWPEGIHNQSYEEWLAHTRNADVPVTVLRIESPEPEVLRQIVLDFAPLTPPRSLEMVTARLDNPHLLKLWLSLPTVTDRVRRAGGALTITRGDLAILPQDLRAALEARWKESPRLLRESLTYCVKSMSPFEGNIILPSLMHRLAQQDGANVFVDWAQGIALAGKLGWLESGYGVVGFREQVMHEVVLDHAREDAQLSGTRVDSRGVATALVSFLQGLVDDGELPPTGEVLTAAAWLAVLWESDARVTPPSTVLAEALSMVAMMDANAGKLAKAVRLAEGAESVSSRLNSSSSVAAILRNRTSLATWLGMLGDASGAATAWAGAAKLAADTWGHESSISHHSEAHHALWRARAGDVEGARRILESLAVGSDSARPCRGDDLVYLFSLLVDAISGKERESAQSLVLKVEQWNREGGHDADVLDEASKWAKRLAADGGLPTVSRENTPVQNRTLEDRHNEATYLIDEGRYGEAAALLSDIVNECSDELGWEHPDTLRAFANHALALGHQGYPAEAIEELEQVLSIWKEISPEATDALKVENTICVFLMEVGEIEDVVLRQRTVVDRASKLLGGLSPTVLLLSNNLLFAEVEAGMCSLDEAVAKAEVLWRRRREVLGQSHPDTFVSWSNYLHFLEERDGVHATLVSREDMARAADASFGDCDLRSLVKRSDLYNALGRAGRVSEAVTCLRALGEELLEVMGAEHEETLRCKNDVVYWKWRSGDVDVISEWARLLQHCNVILGAAHPLTRLVRHNLEYQLREDTPESDE